MPADYSLFVARRLLASGNGNKRLSGPVIKVATAAIALGMAVMIVSVSVGLGFKKEIRDKIVGFGTHVQITSYDYNFSYETNPIEFNADLCSDVRSTTGVRNIQPFIVKPGIIKTADAIQGIALKGVDERFDWNFIRSIMVEGNTLSLCADSAKSNGIVLSQTLATLLKLKVGDAVRMYFIQNNGVRARRFELAGVFDSHFPEFDEKMAFVDMRHLAQLNGWTDTQISGYEVLLDDFDAMDRVSDEIAYAVSVRQGATDEFLRVLNISDLQPQMFGWLALLDTNIVVIIALIIAVAGLNMVSGLLILILENTNMIGILKSMGCPNRRVRRIFMYMAVYIIGRGVAIGNVIGIAVCLVQMFTHVATLDPANYYLDTVPVLLSVPMLLALNVGTMLLTTLMLFVPSFVIARISPAKSIRFN